MYLETKTAYTFDDVLLSPQYTTIQSRKDVDTSTQFTRHHHLSIPIVAANMDTITEYEMMAAMHRLGGVGILHRFMTLDWQYGNMRRMRDDFPTSLICISLGVGDQDWKWLDSAYDSELVNVLCIDIAHGDCDRAIELVKDLRRMNFAEDIIAGNVATPEATRRLCEAGADAVKVGIGPGSMCTTRIITGCGVPQLTAIMECAEVAREYGIPIIADGGLRNSGDIVKALAAGANSVMCGSLLAGTLETPGEIITDFQNKKFKKYRGMASKDAMIDWKGESYSNVTAEGETMFIPLKGSVAEVINGLVGGIRSGMTYNNALTIPELQENAHFRVVSLNSKIENGAHGAYNK